MNLTEGLEVRSNGLASCADGSGKSSRLPG